jgi:hypothetical protein
MALRSSDFVVSCYNYYGAQCNSIPQCAFNTEIYQCLDCAEGQACPSEALPCSSYTIDNCYLGDFKCRVDYPTYSFALHVCVAGPV